MKIPVRSAEMISLHNEDCFDVFPQIAIGTVDLVCADIPYGTTRCRWDSVLDLQLTRVQLYRIAKPSAAIVLFAVQPFSRSAFHGCAD